MRPTLRPGMHVVRRGPGHLQLGWEWPGVAALADDAVARAVLACVDGFRDTAGVLLAATALGVDRTAADRVLSALVEAGALVDADASRPADVTAGCWAGLWLLSGSDSSAPELRARRAAHPVFVCGDGEIAAHVRRLLADEQVPVVGDPGRSTFGVLASDGEPVSSAVDAEMRRGLPFLSVSVRELVGMVGPFVLPGRSACPRCVDITRAQRQHCWRWATESMRRAEERPACPPALAAVTAAYAAQEAALWAGGQQPVTCDAVVEIAYGLGEVQTVAYPQHPECGCGWVGSPGTMTA